MKLLLLSLRPHNGYLTLSEPLELLKRSRNEREQVFHPIGARSQHDYAQAERRDILLVREALIGGQKPVEVLLGRPQQLTVQKT